MSGPAPEGDRSRRPAAPRRGRSPSPAPRRPRRAQEPAPAPTPDLLGAGLGLPQLALRMGLELVEALGRRAGEVIPPEAQVHLLRAQRELLLAARAVLRQQRGADGGGRRARPRPRRIPVD